MTRAALASKLVSWVGQDLVTMVNSGDGWPSRLRIRTGKGEYAVAAHVGPISRPDPRRIAERRFQMREQRRSEKHPKNEMSLLLGLVEETKTHVVVGLDAVARLEQTPRQSLFIQSDQLHQAAQHGWAERKNGRGERIIAFTPRRLPEYVQLLRPGVAAKPRLMPGLTLPALLEFGTNVDDGRLVQGVAAPWYTIVELFERDPSVIYQIDAFKWEEIIAGAYKVDDYEVVLTPRSGDRGRDVIAVKKGICIFDEVKAYKPGHLVSAQEVRAMLGVVASHRNVSKGVITTTSGFAPRLMEDEAIAAHVPYRIELRARKQLLTWLAELRKRKT